MESLELLLDALSNLKMSGVGFKGLGCIAVCRGVSIHHWKWCEDSRSKIID